MPNIIYCFSGSGNCLDMAKKIAQELADTDIVMMRSYPAITDATGYERVGFIFPCHGGGLPGDVEQFIKDIRISDGAYKFGVVQYAGYMGCGLHKLDKLFGLDYWAGMSNHCSAIWLMPHYLTFPHTSLEQAQKRSDKTAEKIAADVKAMAVSAKKPPVNSINAVESMGFSKINKRLNAKMTVSEKCIGCGTCAKLCPRKNIFIVGGKAKILQNCVGCMSCVEYCPKEAINVGTVTIKRERFHNSNIGPEELTKKIIHID